MKNEKKPLTEMNDQETQAIKEVLKTYVNGYLNAESEQIAQAFHPETRLFSVDQDKLEKTGLADWLQNIQDRKKKKDLREGSFEVINIEVTDKSAMAKMVLTLPTLQFTDYLSLLKIGNRWQIIGKIYSVKSLS